jgi:hypothetical protein
MGQSHRLVFRTGIPLRSIPVTQYAAGHSKRPGNHSLAVYTGQLIESFLFSFARPTPSNFQFLVRILRNSRHRLDLLQPPHCAFHCVPPTIRPLSCPMIASFVVSVPLRQMHAACCFQRLSSFPALSFRPSLRLKGRRTQGKRIQKKRCKQRTH